MALTNRFFADAFRDMHRAFSLLDDPSFFNDARRSLASSNNSLGSLRYPATDICETAEGYELHAELPGYDKKDIHIDVSDKIP
jgi:HSP20 family molecular chaperone IbpA